MSDKIRFGMIGCGRNGRGHLECARKVEQLELLATCDINEEQAKACAEEFGAKRWTTDWRELVQQDDLDAVLISVPHTLHAEIAVGAAKAQKHIFIEKPMALSVKEADEMIAAAEENNITLMVGQVLRFRKINQQLKEIVESGELGEVRNLMRRRISPARTFEGPDWYVKPGESFILFNFGSHEMDIMLWLVNSRAEKVFAQGIVVNPEFNDYDEVCIQMKLSNGAVGTLQLSRSVARGAWDMHIIGTKQSIYCDSKTIVIDGRQIIVEAPRRADRVAELQEFASALIEGREPEASGRDVRRTIQALEAAKISLERGTVVDAASL